MPGSEIPDSSSFHSNESNESRCHHNPLPSVLDPRSEIETLNEDLESEFLADSEGERNGRGSPGLNALDSGNEEFRFTTGKVVFGGGCGRVVAGKMEIVGVLWVRLESFLASGNVNCQTECSGINCF